MFLPGMPDGAIRINPAVSLLSKEGRVTWFVGDDNYFSHPADDSAGRHLALATLMDNGHVKPCQIIAALGTPRSSLMRWRRQLEERGAGSFYQPRAVRGGTVITTEKSAQCARLLELGKTIPQCARLAGISVSTLRKALAAGRIVRNTVPPPDPALPAQLAPSTKSQRSQQDAAAAQGIGTACTRAEERTAAAIGLAGGAATRFEPATDIALGGVLCGLPALCSNGLFSGLDRHLTLPKGYYTALHILCVLGFMALARIRRPEQLRHHPPGELGKTIGLDRIPEVRTLREKIARLATTGNPGKWMRELSAGWMKQDPAEAGYLYIDGHVRVYHGSDAVLPRRYVSRQKLCLRGTTDYWVNDALGRPFFVVSKAVTDGLATALIEEIIPELLTTVPNQPTAEQLATDPLLHRFIVVFDREGSHHSLLSQLWEKRIGAITYRKNVTDTWPESEFSATEVLSPGGETTTMRLATRQTQITARNAPPLPVTEVRRLTPGGHQTAIITTACRLANPTIAGRMFSRWCQENYFGYMMEHYDIDGLIQYGSEEMDGTTRIVNPAWRDLDKQHTRLTTQLRRHQAKLGAAAPPDPDDTKNIQHRATLHETIQSLQTQREELKVRRRAIPRKVTLAELPEDQRLRQLLPLAKTLTDTVKMIAYRAETALVGLLRPRLANEAEARALIRELFVSSADLTPDDAARTLTIRIHRMASPVHDRAIALLLADLTAANFQHPETGHRFIYQLV
jgi:DNA-binding CsgD family transcriptional regulator